MSAENPAGGPPAALLWAVGAAVAILVVITLFVVLRGGGGEQEQAAPSPSPSPSATAEASEEPTEPTQSEMPTEQPSEEPGEEPTPTEAPEREPGESDVAAFVQAHGPADQTATGDVTGDGTDEVVLARIRNDSTQIVVGVWDGSAYQRVFRDEGGTAENIERLEIADYNGEPGGEIVTEQTVGEAGRSISVWGRGDGGIVRQEGRRGCWDGSHTYGVNGATIEEGEISATCDASIVDEATAPRDIYQWRRGRWTYDRTEIGT